MNYQCIYDRLIFKRKHLELLTKTNKNHYHRHHIVPLSMNGEDSSTNIVILTPKEHFVAHHLLWKIYKNDQMFYAMLYMLGRYRALPNYELKTFGIRPSLINGRLYAKITALQSQKQSARMSGNGNPMFGSKYKWINDGIRNYRLSDGQALPSNMKYGKIRRTNTIPRKAGKYKWCHNVQTNQNKLILKTEQIPNGYVEGFACSNEHRKQASLQFKKINASHIGKHLSLEHRQKLRNAYYRFANDPKNADKVKKRHEHLIQLVRNQIGKIVINDGKHIRRIASMDEMPKDGVWKLGNLPMSMATRQKISKAHKGKIVSEETRRKLSEARKRYYSKHQHQS